VRPLRALLSGPRHRHPSLRLVKPNKSRAAPIAVHPQACHKWDARGRRVIPGRQKIFCDRSKQQVRRLQAPNTRQTPNPKLQRNEVARIDSASIGVWRLKFGIYLELGVWSLVFLFDVSRKIPFLCGVLRHLCRAWERDARRANAPSNFCFSTI
jgi:hypothetical protein